MIKHFFVIGLGAIINIFISFFGTPVITRLVDPVEYGQLSIFNSYVGIIASVAYLGLNEGLIRFFYEYKSFDEKKSLFKLCLYVSITMSLILSFIVFILSSLGLIGIHYSSYMMFIFLANIVLTVLNTISISMIQTQQDSKTYSMAVVAQKAGYYGVSILMLILLKGKYLLSLVLGTTAGLIVSIVICVTKTKNYWNFKDIKFPNNSKDILKYSYPLCAYFVIFSIYDVVDKLLLENFSSDYEVGLYTAAFSIVGLFTVVQAAFTVMWKPILTENYTNNSENKEYIRKSNIYMTFITTALGLSVIFAKDILVLFVGEKFRSCSIIIPFLVFNPVFNMLLSTVIGGIEKTKKSFYRIIIITLSTIWLFVLSYILIPMLGAIGSAISMASSLVFQYYITMYISEKCYKTNIDIKRSVLCTTMMILYASLGTFIVGKKIVVFIAYPLLVGLLLLMYFNEIKEMVVLAFKQIK